MTMLTERRTGPVTNLLTVPHQKPKYPQAIPGCLCPDCMEIRRAQTGHHRGCVCFKCKRLSRGYWS